MIPHGNNGFFVAIKLIHSMLKKIQKSLFPLTAASYFSAIFFILFPYFIPTIITGYLAYDTNLNNDNSYAAAC